MHFSKMIEINKINLLFHVCLPDSVGRIMTLIKFKGAIYKEFETNIVWHISRNAHNENDIYQRLLKLNISKQKNH